MLEILEQIKADARYRKNVECGRPRDGHPEGSVCGHIEVLERNLAALRPKVSDEAYWKLLVLVHVHDSFKAEARQGVPITHPESHASLARAFLAEFCDDADLLNMVQYHDEPFALWRQYDAKGRYNAERLHALLNTIKDWDLFLAFLIVDGCTDGKDRVVLQWFLREIASKVNSRVGVDWILP